PDVCRLLFVVRVKLLSTRNHAKILGVRLLADDFADDRLGHLGRSHNADQNLASRFGCGARSGIRHYFLPPLLAASLRSRAIVLIRAMSFFSPWTFFKLSVCPIFI